MTGSWAFDDQIGRWLDAGRNADITLLQLARHTRDVGLFNPLHADANARPLTQ
jgi:hypothetical protein